MDHSSCHSPPDPQINGAAAQAGKSTPYQKPSIDDLRQDWPLDPTARAPIVAGLVAMSRRGATHTRRLPSGKTITVKIRRRESLRAMRVGTRLARLALRQQWADVQAKAQKNSLTFNDCVTPVTDLAGQRLTAEARSRGLTSGAELDPETTSRICNEVESQYIAEHGALPEPKGPKPLKEAAPEQRNDWLFTKSQQQEIMARLRDMTDPDGDEYQEMRPREILMAADVLCLFSGLVEAQERLDRIVQRTATPFDWEAFRRYVEEDEPKYLAARRREDEEDEAEERRLREEQEPQGGAWPG